MGHRRRRRRVWGGGMRRGMRRSSTASGHRWGTSPASCCVGSIPEAEAQLTTEEIALAWEERRRERRRVLTGHVDADVGAATRFRLS